MNKHAWLAALLALCLLCAMPFTAVADEAGVLTEAELGAWLNNLLLSTLNVQPLNAPVGEESLTDDGYAFLYDSATLFYNKPTLDAQSVLQAVAVTDEAMDTPRGIRLGAPADMLLTAYGWQNPTLTGDDTFAPLYVLNQLPNAAYWALAQRAGSELQSVQCALHVRMGEDRYTDTGMLYTLQSGVITAIRVYGISATVSLADVNSNLRSITGGQTQGDTQATAGVTLVSAAQPFAQIDLQFSRMDFLTLTEKGAAKLFGEPTADSYAQEESGGWLHTLTFADTSLVFELDAQKQNAQLESLTVTGTGFAGPRGLTVGNDLTAALSLFRSDGTGATYDAVALLYGDGKTAPFGTLERTQDGATARYEAAVTGRGGAALTVALHLSFVNDRLTELMLYRN